MGGMYTYLWGRHGWLFLHSMAYQRQGDIWDSEKCLAFLNALGHVLPCTGCSSHYRRNIEFAAPSPEEASQSVKGLERFVLAMHNRVNETYNLPQVTEEQSRALHQNVDWYQNWYHFLMSCSSIYKPPQPDVYTKCAAMETMAERKSYIEKHVKNPTLRKKYMDHCVTNVYVQILEMDSDTEAETFLSYLEKENHKDFRSARAFVKRLREKTETREGYFKFQSSFYYHTAEQTQAWRDFLYGLAEMLPGTVERDAYQKAISTTLEVEQAVKSPGLLQLFAVKVCNQVSQARGDTHFSSHTPQYVNKARSHFRKGLGKIYGNNEHLLAYQKIRKTHEKKHGKRINPKSKAFAENMKRIKERDAKLKKGDK
jgi:hypothetical protein